MIKQIIRAAVVNGYEKNTVYKNGNAMAQKWLQSNMRERSEDVNLKDAYSLLVDIIDGLSERFNDDDVLFPMALPYTVKRIYRGFLDNRVYKSSGDDAFRNQFRSQLKITIERAFSGQSSHFSEAEEEIEKKKKKMELEADQYRQTEMIRLENERLRLLNVSQRVSQSRGMRM